MTTLDPAFMNTASTHSAITFLDGERGILRYRGIPIEELAERWTFVETAYLLIYGHLPNARSCAIAAAAHPPLDDPRGHEALLRRLPGDRAPDGDPLGDGRARCRAFYPDALDAKTDEQRDITIARLIAKVRDHRGVRLQEVASASRSSTRATT